MNAIDLNTFELKKGSHEGIDEGACIMEMVSYLANEPWSDHPQCACPILTNYAIAINDDFSNEHRQLLKPLVPLLMNTKETEEVQLARKRLILWRNVTVTYPLILEVLKLDEIAAKLRTFENNVESMADAAKYLAEKKEEIRKTHYAYANAYADADASAYAYADANAYATVFGNADVSANAYAYANAYADVYATVSGDGSADTRKAWQDRIAAVAVETLRLACLVTAKSTGPADSAQAGMNKEREE